MPCSSCNACSMRAPSQRLRFPASTSAPPANRFGLADKPRGAPPLPPRVDALPVVDVTPVVDTLLVPLSAGERPRPAAPSSGRRALARWAAAATTTWARAGPCAAAPRAPCRRRREPRRRARRDAGAARGAQIFAIGPNPEGNLSMKIDQILSKKSSNYVKKSITIDQIILRSIQI